MLHRASFAYSNGLQVTVVDDKNSLMFGDERSWKLIGHTLDLPSVCSVRKAMTYYFEERNNHNSEEGKELPK